MNNKHDPNQGEFVFSIVPKRQEIKDCAYTLGSTEPTPLTELEPGPSVSIDYRAGRISEALSVLGKISRGEGFRTQTESSPGYAKLARTRGYTDEKILGMAHIMKATEDWNFKEIKRILGPSFGNEVCIKADLITQQDAASAASGDYVEFVDKFASSGPGAKAREKYRSNHKIYSRRLKKSQQKSADILDKAS
jgi:hypothetical protein